jgi:hypothetical protein
VVDARPFSGKRNDELIGRVPDIRRGIESTSQPPFFIASAKSDRRLVVASF